MISSTGKVLLFQVGVWLMASYRRTLDLRRLGAEFDSQTFTHKDEAPGMWHQTCDVSYEMNLEAGGLARAMNDSIANFREKVSRKVAHSSGRWRMASDCLEGPHEGCTDCVVLLAVCARGRPAWRWQDAESAGRVHVHSRVASCRVFKQVTLGDPGRTGTKAAVVLHRFFKHASAGRFGSNPRLHACGLVGDSVGTATPPGTKGWRGPIRELSVGFRVFKVLGLEQ